MVARFTLNSQPWTYLYISRYATNLTADPVSLHTRNDRVVLLSGRKRYLALSHTFFMHAHHDRKTIG